MNRSLRSAFGPWGWNWTDVGGADIEETEDAYLVEIELLTVRLGKSEGGQGRRVVVKPG